MPRPRDQGQVKPEGASPLPPGTGLPRNVKVLGLVSLFQDAGSELLYPLLPTFVTQTLDAPVVALGAAEGVADATAAVLRLVAGRLSRSGYRRRWIGFGYGIAAVGKLVVAVSVVWPLVIVGRAVDRVGKGIRGVPRDALIADDTTTHNRGRAFGYHRALDTAGAVVGPLVGLALLALLHDRLRLVLLAAVAPALISVALVALVRDHPPAEPQPPQSPQSPQPQPPPEGSAAGSGPHGPLPPGYWRVLVPLVAFALVNSADALLLQRARQLGLGLQAVVLVYVLYNLVAAVLHYPAGVLADHLPPRLIYAAGLVVFGLVYVTLGLTHVAAVVWLALPLYGAYTALTDGVSRTWISNLVTTEQRTWGLGVHGASVGGGVLVASLWSGLAWGHDGRLPLTISGVVAFAVSAWLLGAVRDPARAR